MTDKDKAYAERVIAMNKAAAKRTGPLEELPEYVQDRNRMDRLIAQLIGANQRGDLKRIRQLATEIRAECKRRDYRREFTGLEDRVFRAHWLLLDERRRLPTVQEIHHRICRQHPGLQHDERTIRLTVNRLGLNVRRRRGRPPK